MIVVVIHFSASPPDFVQHMLHMQTYSGTAPSEVRTFIEKNVSEYCGSSGISMWAKIAGLVAMVGGGVALWLLQRSTVTSSEEQAESARNQLLDIKQRLVIAQARLRNLEKVNRAKQAKVQRKLIEQLNAQRRALERSQHTAASKSNKESLASNDINIAEKYNLDDLDWDSIARLRWKMRHDEVLYSDEEEVLNMLDGPKRG